MTASGSARLLALFDAWEDYAAYPTGDPRRLQLAQEILDAALRKTGGTVVLLESNVLRDDGGLKEWQGQGWAYSLTAEVIGRRVRAHVRQVLLHDGRVRLEPSGDPDDAVPIVDARKPLVAELEALLEASRDRGENQGQGRQWYGDLVESWRGMWRDSTFVILNQFVSPVHGLLWENMGSDAGWETPRWALKAFRSPLRNKVDSGGETTQWWESDAQVARIMVDRMRERDAAAVDRVIRIIKEARSSPVELLPDSIPFSALQRPPGVKVTLQALVLHYLTLDPAGPRLTAPVVADHLGFADPRDVRKAARLCQRRLSSRAHSS